jgi:hypothetical protein
MSKFRHATRPAPDPAALERFAAGADSRSVAPAPGPAAAPPVVSSDTKSIDTKSSGINPTGLIPNQTISNDMTVPWLQANPRVIRHFQVRLPEPLHAKLAWLSEQGEGSIHEIVMAGVDAEVERRLAKRGVK